MILPVLMLGGSDRSRDQNFDFLVFFARTFYRWTDNTV